MGDLFVKSKGVISFGEVIMDRIISPNSQSFMKVGGATANVAIRLARKSVPTFYMTKIGTDEHSQYAKQQLEDEGINMSGTITSVNKKLCIVSIVQEDGEREFQSYENDTPNIWLEADELNESIYQKTHISYFGSGTLFHDIAKKTSLKALELAKKYQHFIVMDANIRLKRWKNESDCRKTINSFLKEADLIKMTEEELLFLCKAKDYRTALQQLSSWSNQWILITRGRLGATLLHKEKSITVEAPTVDVVDTTGAGDAFLSSILHDIYYHGIPSNELEWKHVLLRANTEGAHAVSIFGAY